MSADLNGSPTRGPTEGMAWVIQLVKLSLTIFDVSEGSTGRDEFYEPWPGG